tara:strand:+ start:649 stop:996 length:348 start_codon:yes stop_codon:yes gene_type:complete
MDVLKIQKKLRNFSRRRDWDKFHSLKNLAISINIETSELLEIFQWHNEKSDFWKNKEVMNMIEEEIADVILYVLRFSDIAKIDLEKVCLKKIKVNMKKYPINLSKGISTKYNKLK